MPKTESGDEFIKLVNMLPEPSDRLAQLRLRAEELLPESLNFSQFDPHLSLAYGNSFVEQRRRMLDFDSRELPISVRFKQAAIVRAAGSIPVEERQLAGSIAFKETDHENYY